LSSSAFKKSRCKLCQIFIRKINIYAN